MTSDIKCDIYLQLIDVAWRTQPGVRQITAVSIAVGAVIVVDVAK